MDQAIFGEIDLSTQSSTASNIQIHRVTYEYIRVTYEYIRTTYGYIRGYK